MSASFLQTLDDWVWPAGLAVCVAAAVAPAVIVGHVILGPLQKAARRAAQPTQFYLTDFVWLLIQLQAALGLVAAFVARNPAWAFYLVLGFLGGALTAMWWGAVRAMSQAGVQGAFRRAVLILVLLPAVELTLVGAMLFFGAVPLVAYRELRNWLSRLDLAILRSLGVGLAILLGAAIATAAVCWLLRTLTLWLLSEPAGVSAAAHGSSIADQS